MVRGQRMPYDEFNRLSPRRQKVIERNRLTALKTRQKRKELRHLLRRECDILESGVELKIIQIKVLCGLFKRNAPSCIDKKMDEVPDLIELRPVPKELCRKMKKRLHSHNGLARLKNTLHSVQIEKDFLVKFDIELQQILNTFLQ